MTSTVEMPRIPERTEKPPKWMKSIMRTGFGPPEKLRLEQVAVPVPKDGQVLVKVEASSINPADKYNMKGVPIIIRIFLPLFKLNQGIRKPKDPMLGSDLSGRVAAVGNNVTRYGVGDEVYGVAAKGSGAYAEYACAREDRLAPKPANASFEEAAALPIAAITALQALRNHGNIQPRDKVLVNGAGGGVGTYAVQIAKSLGKEVTAVTNTENQDLLHQLGADHVIDYTKEDFTKLPDRYDLIVDVAATHSFGAYKRILNPGGRMILVGMKDKIFGRLIYFILMRPILGRGDKKFRFFVAKINDQDLAFLKDLMETRRMISVIDSRYQLSETPEAFRHFEKGNIRGKVVITTGQN